MSGDGRVEEIVPDFHHLGLRLASGDHGPDAHQENTEQGQPAKGKQGKQKQQKNVGSEE